MGGVSTERGLGSWLRWSLRVLIATGAAVMLSYLPYRVVGRSDDRKLANMRAELARVRAETAAIESNLGERRRLVRALKTDTRIIEDIARDELQMLYPHEKTLRLSPGRKQGH